MLVTSALALIACRGANPTPRPSDTGQVVATADTSEPVDTGHTGESDTGLPSCLPETDPCQPQDVPAPMAGEVYRFTPSGSRSVCLQDQDVLEACDLWMPEFDGCPPEDWVGFDAWVEVTAYSGGFALNRKNHWLEDPSNPGHILERYLYYLGNEPIYVAIDRIADPENRWWCCNGLEASEIGYGDVALGYGICRPPHGR